MRVRRARPGVPTAPRPRLQARAPAGPSALPGLGRRRRPRESPLPRLSPCARWGLVLPWSVLVSSGLRSLWGLDPLKAGAPPRGLDAARPARPCRTCPPVREASGAPLSPPRCGARCGQEARLPVLSCFSVSPQILRVIFTRCTRPSRRRTSSPSTASFQVALACRLEAGSL